MNQYLNETNQNMIWKVINNAPQVIQKFQHYQPGTKEKWFQSIIKNVYQQFNGSSISLKELNKRTLDFMLQSLEPQQPQIAEKLQQPQIAEKLQQPQIAEKLQQPQIAEKLQPNFADQTNFVKPREQILSEQFEMRKKEYESMTKKTVPKPEFTNAIRDEAINDIGSAVEEYMKQRDADIPTYAPILQPTEDLPTEPKKRVQWGDNIEKIFDNQLPVVDYTDKIKTIEDYVKKMGNDITELNGRIKSLENILSNVSTSR
jgi:hypothetical protein